MFILVSIPVVGRLCLSHALHISHKPRFLQTFSGTSVHVCAPLSPNWEGEERRGAIRHSPWHFIMKSGVLWGWATWQHGEEPPWAAEPKREARGGRVRKCPCDEREREGGACGSQPGMICVCLLTLAQNHTERTNTAHASQLPKALCSNLIPQVGFVSLSWDVSFRETWEELD